jgi:hypothetical protein
MSGVSDAPIALVPLMGIALAVLAALVLAGLWFVARRLPGNRARGRARITAPGGLAMAAIVLLVCGGFFFLVGWVAGAVLLWISPRWRLADKLLGTLVWPGGLLLILYIATMTPGGNQICIGGAGATARCAWTGLPAPPPWAGIMTLVVLALGQLATAVWLWWRATRSIPGQGADGVSVAPAP